MKSVPLKEAVGMVIGHDMTEIIPGESKDAAFRKGHIIKEEDIPRLLKMGKENIYMIDMNASDVHENEAAIRMAEAASGQGIILSDPKEGKVSLKAEYPGLLKVNYEALHKINSIDRVIFSTLHTNQEATENQLLAGTRVIPLVIDEAKIEEVEKICKDNYPIIKISPFQELKVGMVITGNEVYYKRIEDQFGPVIKSKVSELGCAVMNKIYSKDDSKMISESINQLIEEGAELITVTGGMSVDPDDVTPTGIRESGANIISYGAPTLPGAMFLLAYYGEIPVVGLPGCVMYSKRTIFDLVVPRLVAGEKVQKEDIIGLGHGGLCLDCEFCTYPNCGFGKGGLS